MSGYDAPVVQRYPTIRAGVIHATGLRNGPSSPDLLEAYLAEQRSVSERLSAFAVADLPSIAAWRRVFTGFGANRLSTAMRPKRCCADSASRATSPPSAPWSTSATSSRSVMPCRLRCSIWPTSPVPSPYGCPPGTPRS